MYRVLIVDDEPLVRKRIIYGFEWQQLGFEICGEAGNGRDALEMIQKQAPDLAIVDIAMPIINGIELAKQIWKSELTTNVIFLTGHSEFKYAQEAIRYGVRQYVLKPIDEDEFVLMVQQMKQQLDSNRLKDKHAEQLQHQNSSATEIVKAKRLSDFFHGYMAQADSISEYRAQLPQQHGVLLQLRIEEYIQKTGDIAERQQNITRIVSECLPEQCKSFCFYDIYRDYLSVFCIDNSKWTPAQIAKTVYDQLRQTMNGEIYCGYASMDDGDLPALYHRARAALSATRYHTDAICAAKTTEKKGVRYQIPSEYLVQLRKALNQSDTEQCQRVIQAIFNNIVAYGVDYQEFEYSCQKLLDVMAEEHAMLDMDFPYYYGDYHDLRAIMKSVWTQKELCAWFVRQAEWMIAEKATLQKRKQNYSKLVENAKQMIETAYADKEVSITGIANQLHVNTSYLSSMFKQYVGMSATKYLSFVRLERSKELLLTTEKTLGEVSDAVGFNDEYYFSKCFKKYYGDTPSQVRKRLRA